MYQTPWTKKASSLPSDRIQPKLGPLVDMRAKSKPKGRQEEPTKSKQVRKLESLLTALQEPTEKARRAEKDPKGGCFCLGMYVCRINSTGASDLINSANTPSLAPCPAVYLLRIYSLHHQSTQLCLCFLFFTTSNTVR